MPGSTRAGRAFSFSSLLSVGAIALWVAGCGGSDAGCTGPFCVPPPEQPVAASIQPGPNDGRPGVANRQQPIDVVVTDSAGRGVSGVTVNFSVSSGGGTVSSPTAQSDNAGLAQVSWTLGPELGPQALQATATNATGDPLKNSPLALSAVAGLAQPTQIVLVTAPPDTAQNGIPLVPQPVLQVFDADHQPVTQVQVVASVSSGGASLSGTTTMTSDDSGQISFSDLALAGVQGPQSLQFQVASTALQVTSDPIQLIPGVPATLTGVEPLAYTGTVGSPVSPGPSVVVKDVAGNPVPGVEVIFTANRRATVSPDNATTNEQGVAQVT